MKLRSTICLLLAGCGGSIREDDARVTAAAQPALAFTDAGALVRPVGFETWVAVGSSIGLSYSEHARSDGPGEIHTVYLEPGAFEAYRTTGRFPEGTVLVLALHAPRQHESIARQGFFQGDLVAVEAAVKDRERFPESWAYFDFGKGGLEASARAKPPQACHGCHLEHADDDNVFVQFYPPLRALHAARQAVRSER